MSDVTVIACTEGDGFTGPTATVEATNDATFPTDFRVKVTYLYGSTEVGSGIVDMLNVQPGGSATAVVKSSPAPSGGPHPDRGGLTCQITEVEKTLIVE